MVRLVHKTFSLLGHSLLPESVQITLLDSNDFGADFDDVIKAVSVLHRQTVKPTYKRKGYKALNIRPVDSAQDDF